MRCGKKQKVSRNFERQAVLQVAREIFYYSTLSSQEQGTNADSARLWQISNSNNKAA